MEDEMAAFRKKQEHELKALQVKNVEQMQALRERQLREVFVPFLRITGAQPSSHYGCYELRADISSDAAPVYQKCNSEKRLYFEENTMLVDWPD